MHMIHGGSNPRHDHGSGWRTCKCRAKELLMGLDLQTLYTVSVGDMSEPKSEDLKLVGQSGDGCWMRLVPG